MGEIRVDRAPSGRVRATAYFRDIDGRTREVERTAASESAAKARLRAACRDRAHAAEEGLITAGTAVSEVAEMWFADVAAAVASGDRSPATGELYRRRLDNQILPALGSLRLREMSVSRVDRFIKDVRERHGPGTAKSTRSVLSGLLGLAVRYDALDGNPVRDVSPIRRTPKESHALTLAEVRHLRAALGTDQTAIDRDVVDVVDMMIATGLRIGETIGMTWPAVDLDRGTAEVRGTAIRIAGVGVVIKEKPKSRSGWRVIELPSWALDMLRHRHDEHRENQWQAIFTSPTGLLRDPSNTQADLREALTAAGYPHVTSHTFRRTVATLMDHAGLSARAAADQLGHAQVSMTTDVYFGRRVASTGARAVLEAIADATSASG